MPFDENALKDMQRNREEAELKGAHSYKEEQEKAQGIGAATTPGATTISARINNSKRTYTYQCMRPVEVGDMVNIKLPHGGIITVAVEEVHPEPQLSDKWETKWCVVVQTKAEYEASLHQASELGAHLGL